MSKIIDNVYKNGLIRNYFEIIQSYNSFKAYNDLANFISKKSVYPNEFLAQCSFALFDSCISHLIKVIVFNSKSYTFQNILKYNKQKALNLMSQNSITIDFYKEMQTKFKDLRAKYFFHIDKLYLDNPDKIWQEIKVSGNDIKKLISGIYNVINSLYLEEIDRYPRYIEYSDKSVLDFLEKNNY